jgi:hypothetical protein
MALRITVSSDGDKTEILLEGRLLAAGIPDLQAEFCSAGSPVRLNLSGLQGADEAGIFAIQSLRAAGADLHGASPYILQLLEQKTL